MQLRIGERTTGDGGGGRRRTKGLSGPERGFRAAAGHDEGPTTNSCARARLGTEIGTTRARANTRQNLSFATCFTADRGKRAIEILRDVLGYQAKEVAFMLDSTEE